MIDEDSDGNSAVEDPDVPGPSRSSQRRSQKSRRREQSRKRILSTSTDAAASSSSAMQASPTPGPSCETNAAETAPSKKKFRPVAAVEFPEWMRLVKPCRFPYISQIGDVVVYFRQGLYFLLDSFS